MQRQCWSGSIDSGSYAGRWTRSPSWRSELGMDVPFFLYGGAAVATGRGETALTARRVGPRARAGESARSRSAPPRCTVGSRRRCYSDGGRAARVTRALATHRPDRVAASLYNGLEPAAGPRYPQIEQMRAALVAAGALGAVMSGSGPTVFGMARSLEQARQIRARVTRGALGVLGGADAARARDPDRSRDDSMHLGRGQAARRGTLDPVFGGSNPPAPTTIGAVKAPMAYRAEALLREREPPAGRGDRPIPARPAGRARGLALLRRRGLRADQRERARRRTSSSSSPRARR